jgi:hypothetical protein
MVTKKRARRQGNHSAWARANPSRMQADLHVNLPRCAQFGRYGLKDLRPGLLSWSRESSGAPPSRLRSAFTCTGVCSVMSGHMLADAGTDARLSQDFSGGIATSATPCATLGWRLAACGRCGRATEIARGQAGRRARDRE